MAVRSPAVWRAADWRPRRPARDGFSLVYPDHIGALILFGAITRGVAFDSPGHYRRGRNQWGEETASPQNLMRFPMEILDNAEALPHLSEIQLLTLVMVGEFDIADNHAHCGVIQISIKNSEWQVVRHSGHLVYLEQPDRFNQLVIEFLNRRVNNTPAQQSVLKPLARIALRSRSIS